MEEILSDIGSTPSLEPVTDDNLLDLFNAAAGTPTTHAHPHPHPHTISHPQSEDDHPVADHPHGLAHYDESGTQQDDAAEEKKKNKLHTCGFCGAMYTSYRELVEHRASHGGSRPYECHICDKRFTQKAHLIIHRRTHTGNLSGEKPYSCHICHKRFSQTSHLNSHKRVHTGEKPFFCSICNMGFCRRQRLEAHLQQHAKDVQQSLTGGGGGSTHDLMSSLSSHNSLQQQQHAAFGSGAKDFLMSIGLGSVMDDAGIDREDEGTTSTPKGPVASSRSRMAVFPGFSMEGGEEGGNRGSGDHEQGEGEDSIMSRSPTPNSSPRPPTPTSKSRRKPAFVRKLWGGQADREEGGGDRGDSGEDGRAELSAHTAAAVTAMMCMASGGDYPVSEDLPGDLLALGDNSTPHSTSSSSTVISSIPTRPNSLPSGGGGGVGGGTTVHDRNRNHSAKAYPLDHLVQGKPTSLSLPSPQTPLLPSSAVLSLIRTNSRVSLVDFTADDLLRHLMSRDDVFRCDFCKIIFQDAAMYHLHRSMHDKMDIRCCNLCGKLLKDKYDFIAHFMSQHK